MSYKDEVYELIHKAYEYNDMLEYSLAIPLFEKAVSIASEYPDILFQMYCRFDLIDTYSYYGDTMKAFINFLWYNNQIEKGYTNEKVIYNLIWHYKFIGDSLADVVSIPKDKINDFLNNMEKVYKENNISLKSYYKIRIYAYMKGIDTEIDIDEYYKKWMYTIQDDKFEDCIACNLDFEVEYHIFLRNYDKALKKAENIINGKYKCDNIPNTTFATLLLPIYDLGKYELADELQKKGIRLIKNLEEYGTCLADHIMYLSLVNIEKAIKIFEKGCPQLMDINKSNIDDMERTWFNMASFVLFHKIEEKNIEKIKVKIPKNVSIYSENEYEVSDLKEFFKDEFIRGMNAFDIRNGNSIVSDDMKKYLEICGIREV